MELDIAKVNKNTMKLLEHLYKALEQRGQYKQQRDELIEDIKKLRKNSDKYNYLTNHIKDKALHNPSVSRYIDLVHFIDDLERDTHEG